MFKTSNHLVTRAPKCSLSARGSGRSHHHSDRRGICLSTVPATSIPGRVDLRDLSPSQTHLANRVDQYAKAKLSPDTYRHSLRVYSYWRAIAQECFRDWGLISGSPLDETWFLTALLYDIGTTDDFIHNIRLSYEFFSGCSRSQDPAGHSAHRRLKSCTSRPSRERCRGHHSPSLAWTGLTKRLECAVLYT